MTTYTKKTKETRYKQDLIKFSIACLAMLISLAIFFHGTSTVSTGIYKIVEIPLNIGLSFLVFLGTAKLLYSKKVVVHNIVPMAILLIGVILAAVAQIFPTVTFHFSVAILGLAIYFAGETRNTKLKTLI